MQDRFPTLRRDVADGVAVITLDRPEKLNAMSPQMAADLYAALDVPAGVRALVLTGDRKAFSAGADLHSFEEPLVNGITWQDTVNKLADTPLSTVAAIEGWCLGGGLLLALCCDLRVSSEAAMLGFPEIHRGFFPGTSASIRLVRLIGRSRAKQMMMLGDHVDAVTAEQWGLLNYVVAEGKALETASSLAARLAAGPPTALAATKRLVEEGGDLSVADGIALEHSLILELADEMNEGVQAFRERRPPAFSPA